MSTPIRRFSSRRQKLAQSFLAERLRGARSYDRIAGYFCGSILETAGEALESVEGTIRLVCFRARSARRGGRRRGEAAVCAAL